MIAVISDIHGNLEALDAVCADIAAKNVERVYCLGDVVGYGPDPRACIDKAMEFEFTIMGNHDHAVFMEPTGFNTPAETAVFWSRQTLDNDPDEAARRKRWEFLARMAQVFDLVRHVCFVGHTHLPGVFTDSFDFYTPAQVGHKYVITESKAVVNVGSVGQPRDLDPRACYVTVEGPEVRWHRVAYDYKTTKEKILATGVLDEFLANRLAEGR